MSKVFVVNSAGHDFDTAKSYGELVYLSNGSLDKYELTKMFRLFHEHLKDSSREDYILQSGPTIMNIIAASIFVAMHGKLNLLIWRAEQDGSDHYVCRRINFETLKGESHGDVT